MSSSDSAPFPLTSKKQQRCNICNIVFDSIETLNSHNRMEYAARHLPVGVKLTHVHLLFKKTLNQKRYVMLYLMSE